MATLRAISAPMVLNGDARQSVWHKVASFPVFLAALLIAGVFICARLNPPEPDTWWHIATGDSILRTWQWPTVDPYSFTARGTEWMAYEWLGEVAMAVAQRLGGTQGQAFLLILLACSIFLQLYYYCYLRSGDSKASFVACVCVLPMAALFFTLRPQLFGYAFLLLTLICLKRFRQERQRHLWILPLVFLVWVNTHGSFTFGLLAVGLYWICGLLPLHSESLIESRWSPQQSRHLGSVFLLSVLAVLITPYGPRMAAYPLQMAFMQPVNIGNIREWQPLTPDLLIGKLFVVLVVLFFLAQVLHRIRYRPEEIALLLFAAFAASLHRRFFLLFLLVFAPLVALLLTRWVPAYRPEKDKYALNAVAIVLVAAGLVAFFPRSEALQQVVARNYPDKAVAYLAQSTSNGPMLNEYGWGGYLIWALDPLNKVFIDGRADLYEYSGVLADYLSIVRLEPNAQALLEKYGIQSCLIRRNDPLSTFLLALPDWERVYVDEVSAIFVNKKRQVAALGQGVGFSPSALRTGENDEHFSPPLLVSGVHNQ